MVSLLAGAALAWRVGSAGAQSPSGAVVTPVPGAWTPRVIATSRPVNNVEQPKPAAVLPGRPQESDIAPAARVASAESKTPSPEPLRLVGDKAPREQTAPPGACLVVERVAPAQIAAGKLLSYEIVVRNVGAAEAQRVRVEEQVPAGAVVTLTEPRAEARGTVLAWDLGILAASAEARIHVSMQPSAEGDVSATATVTNATTSTLHTRVARAGVSLTVGDLPPTQVGQKATFQIRIANNTTAPLSGLVLRARLSAGLQHSQGSLIEAGLPALAPGEIKAVPLEVVAAKAGRSTLTATLTGAGTDSKTAEAAIEVSDAAATAPAPVPSVVTGSPEVRPTPLPGSSPTPAPPAPPSPTPPPIPALPPPELLPQSRVFSPGRTEKPIASAGGSTVTLDLADAAAALEVGGETTYEIRVLNQGAAPTRDVLVQALVPDEMTLVRADGPGGQPAQVQGKQVAFGPLSSLDGQGRAVYRVRVKALKPGDGRFTARLQCGEMARPLSQEVSTRVYSGELPVGEPTQR
jgi:uncharacterized repeat protein (TIGR01451 family)